MSSYWDIRKQKSLDYLPPPPPPAERGGLRDNDIQLLRSRAWMMRYHEEKKATEKRHAEAKRNAEREHADAPGASDEEQRRG